MINTLELNTFEAVYALAPSMMACNSIHQMTMELNHNNMKCKDDQYEYAQVFDDQAKELSVLMTNFCFVQTKHSKRMLVDTKCIPVLHMQHNAKQAMYQLEVLVCKVSHQELHLYL